MGRAIGLNRTLVRTAARIWRIRRAHGATIKVDAGAQATSAITLAAAARRPSTCEAGIAADSHNGRRKRSGGTRTRHRGHRLRLKLMKLRGDRRAQRERAITISGLLARGGDGSSSGPV